MQVYDTKNLAFTSRNPHIRFADNIARHVNNVCPRISSTKYEGLKNSDKFNSKIKGLLYKIKFMRQDLYCSLHGTSGNYVEKSKRFT